MNVVPIKVPKVHSYYTGVFNVLKNSGISEIELIEVKQALSGSRVEDYFPLIIDCMNKRGNWQHISTKDALETHKIDLSWTNSSKLNTKSKIHSRLQLDSVDHYISNKKAFYEQFKYHDFIPSFIPFNKDVNQETLKKFIGKPVIIKPDLGSVSAGILVQKEFNYDEIIEHINQYRTFKDWTISEIVLAKLVDNYIVSNRIYFLVTKTVNKTEYKSEVKGYMYKNFMNYRANNKFTGDITDPEQFLTNYYSKIDIMADEIFVRTRYIPNEKYLANFTEEEQKIIYGKLEKMFGIILETIAENCLADNENQDNDINRAFHIYGADVIIDKDLNVKILEMNGAPAMNVKSRLYGLVDRLDYFDLFEEAFQKIVDPIFPPLIKQKELNVFQLVGSVTKNHNKKLMYYIPNSIVTNYPYILDALKKREGGLKRTKNMHDKIDLFYGLRERYVVDETNMNYYDEILNYLTSKRMRKASIINKIQGITYFLANKGRMYSKLLQYKDKTEIHKYHPFSEMILYNGNNELIQDKINDLVDRNPNIKNWIIKPIHGSRGKGIEIFRKSDKRLDFLSETVKNKLLKIRMADYICQESGMKDGSVILKRFNGMDLTVSEKVQIDKYWIISEYIDNPHLLKLDKFNDSIGRKYNIRAYVLVDINGRLPTYGNINEENKNAINLYMFYDMMIYCSMLEYKEYTGLPEEYKGLDKQKYLDKMIHLTNLEVVNNVYDELNIPGKSNMKGLLTTMLSKRKDIDGKSVRGQAKKIIEDTINSVKYDLRPLNRHNENYKGAFNLLAYDLLLDDQGILHLIEINRGPDLKGLEMNIGYGNMVGFFDDIFKIVLDKEFNLDYWKKIKIDYDAIKIDY